MQAATDNIEKTYYFLGNDYKNNYIEIKFYKPVLVNCAILEEPVFLGQKISRFTITIFHEDSTGFEIEKQTIGHKRIVTFPTQMAKRIRITVNEAKGNPVISGISVFRIADDLVEN